MDVSGTKAEAMQREYFKCRKSPKYKKLQIKFKKLKRRTLKDFYSKFVSDLKLTDPENGIIWQKKLELSTKVWWGHPGSIFE